MRLKPVFSSTFFLGGGGGGGRSIRSTVVVGLNVPIFECMV